MSALLEARDLRVEFRPRGRGWASRKAERVTAVDGVSLSLRPGEVVALVGESGSGKTTLARALLGLVEPAAGEVLWEGRPFSGQSPAERADFHTSVQMVFQSPRGSLNPRMRVGQVLEEVLSFTGRPAGRGAVEELLDSVGLGPEIFNALPIQLSGGQCQRLGVARALAVQPRVLLLDEPTSALDVSEQARLVNLFGELQARLGLSLLFISHDLSLVRLFSHRVMILRDGRTVEEGTTGDLMGHPVHEYTRRLVQAARSSMDNWSEVPGNG